MTRAQLAWAVVGLAVLVLVAIIARGNLEEIYKQQPDFVLGSLLAIVGFCFAKAFTRTAVNSALEMIRGDRSVEVAGEMDKQFARRLHDRNVHSDLALAKRNVVAAARRSAEFYDLQSKDPRFYINAPLMRVILDDLDEALASIMNLERAVESPDAQSAFVLPVDVRSELGDVLRDVREAVQRRNETYEALVAQFERAPADDLWGAFAVLSSDTLKALRDLEALMAKCLVQPPDGRLTALAGYIAAALRRAHEVDNLISTKALARPAAMATLIEDLAHAQDKLARIDLGPRLTIGGKALTG
ncbi:hypothetical protein GCM10023334_026020 [Nonomuraea thailandensis]